MWNNSSVDTDLLKMNTCSSDYEIFFLSPSWRPAAVTWPQRCSSQWEPFNMRTWTWGSTRWPVSGTWCIATRYPLNQVLKWGRSSLFAKKTQNRIQNICNETSKVFLFVLHCRSGCCGRFVRVRRWSRSFPTWCQCCWRAARIRHQRPGSCVGSVWGSWAPWIRDAWTCRRHTPMATTTPLW